MPEVPRPEVDAYLTISRPDRFFRGMIDEPKVRIALPPETYELGDGVEILGERQMIYFDTRGSLDPAHHVNAVVIRPVQASQVEEVTGNTAVADGGIQSEPGALLTLNGVTVFHRPP